jgi:hypothetical protein
VVATGTDRYSILEAALDHRDPKEHPRKKEQTNDPGNRGAAMLLNHFHLPHVLAFWTFRLVLAILNMRLLPGTGYRPENWLLLLSL